MSSVICKSCKWVHFEVSKEYMENEVSRFNKYFYSLPLKKRKEYYGNKPSSFDNYTKCFFCSGPYTNFRKAKKEEIPYGSTMQPILNKKEII